MLDITSNRRYDDVLTNGTKIMGVKNVENKDLEFEYSVVKEDRVSVPKVGFESPEKGWVQVSVDSDTYHSYPLKKDFITVQASTHSVESIVS